MRHKLSAGAYFKRYYQLYLLALPGMACILLFSYIPIFGWYMAVSDYQIGKQIWEAPFAGFKYFREFFIDSGEALSVIRNTLVMNVGTLVLSLSLAMLFAIMLHEMRGRRYKKLVQSVTFFPYFLSWVMLYSVVYSLFSNSDGAVNNTLMRWGLIQKPINLMGDPKLSWVEIISLNIWNGLGYDSVIFIAAIASIPAEQFEAAQIDGATRWQKIWYVTLPNLLGTLSVLLIMSVGWLFNSGLDKYFLFTNSMNIETMEVFDYYVYRYGMKLFNYSYATAVSVTQALVSIILITGVNAFARHHSEHAIF